MANIYVRSTDGSDADNGSTWALAKATLAGAAAIDAAGDVIYVSQAHAESTNAALSPGWAGTAASPIRIVCANDGAEPPTAVASTATVTTTGNSNISVIGSATEYAYFYGLTYIAGSGASGTASISIASGKLENCSFQLATTGTASRINLGGSGVGPELLNCTLKFGATAQSVSPAAAVVSVIKGGSILSGSSAITNFAVTSQQSGLLVDGFDFSNAASSMSLANGTSQGVKYTFRNCKLPGSWSGSLNAATPGRNSVFELINCDSADTHYRYRKATQFGTIQDETTLVMTGGATDGTTTISGKMVTNANVEFPMLTMDSEELTAYNTTVGSSVTATVEFLRDSATNLKDDEIWLELYELGTSGVPLASFANDAKADVLATAADQASSSVTWTTTGMANPNKQKATVTFTPQEEGWVVGVLKCAKASTTLYYNPRMTLA